ncbi:MAG: serine/threonine protein kinase [Planctomycetes bacterium]|nr:serine/threonine protein kinase [Planctomycetota bacterium]
MHAPRSEPVPPTPTRVDWESFYQHYRKPGYVPGFEIVHKLGGGMFGLVFKARKESIGKDYAIKFLKVDDETVRDAVGRELETVHYFAQIDHPNLVSIEDKGVVDGIPFLVMSYAGQETLQKRLQQGGMTREQALHVFVQAARGVQALHEHSLVHFDLKPANIFLKGDVARVGDYGLSKLVSASRNSLSFGRGTPYYMAPEMLQRRGDARSDIYSLGIILYECLYGDVPFRGDSEWEVLRKHEVAAPEFPPHSLPEDRAILSRCLAKRPEDRFASVAELLGALRAPAALGESLRFDVPPPAAPTPAAAAAALPRDTAASPYGMPWRATPRGGAVAHLVQIVFGLFEAAIFVVLLPVRAASAFAGRGVVWLFQLPFRILGALARLIGLLVVLGLAVLACVVLFHLVAAI